MIYHSGRKTAIATPMILCLFRRIALYLAAGAFFFSVFHMEAQGQKRSGIGRIALLGDSLTWLGGDSCSNPKGWSHWLKQSGIAQHIDSYARSGATWTTHSETMPDTDSYTEILHPNNVIVNQARRLKKRIEAEPGAIPDIILVMAGTNDAWFFPADTLRLESSVVEGCTMLRELVPNVRLIAVTPPNMSKATEETIARTGGIIERAAGRCGVEVLRADRDLPFSHDRESASPLLTYDGVHTNQTGARIIADYVTNWILNSKETTEHE